MKQDAWKCRTESLLSMTVEYIVNNLSVYMNNDKQCLELLPGHIRDRILRKFTTSSYFWTNVNFQDVVSKLVHPNTKSLNLTNAEIDDNLLNILTNCYNLKKLYLTRVNDNYTFTTEGLIKLFKHTKNLCVLQLRHTEAVTDDVLETIAKNCPLLTGLDIGGCKNVTDRGITALAQLKHLVYTTFSQTQIGDEGISAFIDGNSGANIVELRIDNCTNITDASLKKIADTCPKIQTLIFNNCSPSTNRNQTLSSFQEHNFKNLKQLTWTVTW